MVVSDLALVAMSANPNHVLVRDIPLTIVSLGA